MSENHFSGFSLKINNFVLEEIPGTEFDSE